VLDKLWERKMGPSNIEISDKLELPQHIENGKVRGVSRELDSF
jgi:hypothetical protein